MTKGEIVGRLLNMTAHGTQDLADAVFALDVCTSAERELVEAYADPSETVEAFTRRTKALDALIAERTPPDPVEVFIARARAAWKLKRIECQEQLGYALVDLDAARGKP